MKTYLSNIIPELQKFSKKLDDTSQLANRHWLVINDDENFKVVYIFRLNKELLISTNGKVTKGSWENLGNNTILIDIGNESYLFKQAFFNDDVIALKLDNNNKYAFLVNENAYSDKYSTVKNIENSLRELYIDKPHLKVIKTNDYINNSNLSKTQSSTQSYTEVSNGWDWDFICTVIGVIIGTVVGIYIYWLK